MRAGKLDAISLTQNTLRSFEGELAETSRLLAELGSLTLHETNNQPGQVGAELHAIRPHVVVLCCSAASPQSLVDAANSWLPALEAPGAFRPSGWPYLPVVLALTKYDAFTAGAWVGAGQGGVE